MNRARILIVEDEAILAMTLEEKLTRLGYSVLKSVSTGEDALAEAREERPDLVLMDIRLSGDMDGITAAGHIKSFSDVPIIYLTGHSDEPLLQRAKQTEPYAYLIKPVSIQELKASLEMALHQYDQDKKLEESEKRYRSIVENINDAMIIHDFEGRVMDVNENACLMLGYERSELIGSDLSLFSTPLALSRLGERMDTLQKEQGIVFETRLVSKDGTYVPAEVSAKVVSRESAGVVQSFVRDITERKQYEEEIVQKNEQLEKALAERDKFFSIIAHDLRSPLIGFLVFIRMLNDKIGKMSLEEIERLAKEMKHSAKNLYNLLENLLEWSLIQRGVRDHVRVSCCLADIVRENVDLIQTSAMHKNITLKSQIPENLYVFTDKSMLKMILRNLLTNAVKFSRTNAEVEVSARTEGSSAVVSVADSGVGMDQEMLSRLFMPDKMTSRKGTAREKGTGLGLILCKEFVKIHGGKIRVESKPGQGTKVSFSLPIHNYK